VGTGAPRASTSGKPVKGSGAATTAVADAEAEDSEEIDVSDQLEELDDTDPVDDLDGSDDLIIDDEEDDETSTSVSVWGAGAVRDAATAVRAARPEPLITDMNLNPETKDHGRGEAPVRDSSESAARGLGSVHDEPPTPEPQRMRMPSEMKTPKQTLVEAGTEFKGTLKSSCPVVVNGTIDGDIDAPTLSIASTGAILGNVKAKTLHSQGTLSGSVEAEEVFLSGAVRSKTVIKTRRLEVKLGSSDKGQLEVTFGNCDLEVSDSSEADPSGALLSTPDGENDPYTSNGWDTADTTAGSVSPAAALVSAGRSTAKASRRNEGSLEEAKKTLR
jgi:cytoskeletal protein CcmA (bactofilin family)